MSDKNGLDKFGAIVGAAVGSYLGNQLLISGLSSFAGPLGAAVGAVLGIAVGEISEANRRPKTTTIRPRTNRTYNSQTLRQTSQANKSTVNKPSVVCPKCQTANTSTNLLCEYCGERLPVKLN